MVSATVDLGELAGVSDGRVFTIWIRTEFENQEGYDLTHEDVACRSRAARRVRRVRYDSDGMVTSDTGSPEAEWRRWVPGSIGEYYFVYACEVAEFLLVN